MNAESELLADLQRSLTMVVRRTAVPRVHDRIIARAGVGIERVEAVALSRIVDSGTVGLTDLARQLGVACSTAGRHAGHLEERGLVSRSTDPEDGRATVVTATGEGEMLMKRLRAAYRDLLAETLANWEPSDLESLTHLMGRLADDLRALSEPVEAVT